MSLAAAAPSATRLAADVRAGRTTPRALVEQALARIAETDPQVRAWVLVDEQGARAQADGDLPDGPLRGVPVGVKDLYDVRGQVSRAGSRVPAGPPATADSPAVARLRAAGAVVVGRTRTHEFAWGLTTQHEVLGGTRNPYDPGRVPGGSSGGSAAAVATGAVPLALGTDTGCSIRLPAAWCGLVGHKPTWGRVPLDGVVPLAPSLDHGGALVRTVEDARLALEVLTGERLPPVGDVRGLRLGVVDVPAVPGVARRVEQAARAAAGVGLRLRPAQVPLADRQREAYALAQSPEALAWHRGTGRWPQHRELYGSDVRGHLERCEAQTPEQTEHGRRLRARLRAETAALFEDVDLLLLPVAGCGPPTTAEPGTADLPDGSRGPVRDAVLPWTVLADLCGLPACAVPAGLDDDGLPVGVQLVGAQGADALVLDAAAALERALSG